MPTSLSSLSCLPPTKNISSDSSDIGIGDAALRAPPPAPSRGRGLHQRSQTAIFPSERNLPPLITEPTQPPCRPQLLPFKPSFTSPSASSPSKSPVRSGSVDNVGQSVMEGASGQTIQQNKRVSLASWFNGSSDPVNLTMVSSPIKEEADPMSSSVGSNVSRASLTDTNSMASSRKLQKRPTSSPITNQSAASSRFSLFKPKTPETRTVDLDYVNEELMNLDIEAALFHTGAIDPFSPSAFKNLQLNAEGTIRRFQGALKQNTLAIAAMSSKMEELDAAQTRMEHLKRQLDDTANRAAQQEESIRELANELAREKQRRFEEEEARKKTIKLVPEHAEEVVKHETPSRRHRKRTSGASSFNDSELSSEVDSSADSIFSERVRAETPTTPVELSLEILNMPYFPPSTQRQSTRRSIPPSHRHSPNTPRSLQDFSSTTPNEPILQTECGHCKGLKANDAWDLVQILQAENKGLKERLALLESAQDEALNFVNGLKFDVSI